MAASLSNGDRVSWMTSQGRTHGTIREVRTTDFQFDGQTFTATTDAPAFVVESEKSGKRAAHKGTALRKLST